MTCNFRPYRRHEYAESCIKNKRLQQGRWTTRLRDGAVHCLFSESSAAAVKLLCRHLRVVLMAKRTLHVSLLAARHHFAM
jgi:hypothetical protein